MPDIAIDIIIDAPVVSSHPLTPIAIVRADALPDLVFTIQGEDGANVSLTGATSTFKIRRAGTSTTVNDANNTCTMSLPDSTCTYDLITTDFARAGMFEGELAITFTGALLQTVYKNVYMKVRDSF